MDKWTRTACQYWHGSVEASTTRERGASEVVQFDNIYRLCYIRGTEGLLIGLAEQLGDKTATDVLENS